MGTRLRVERRGDEVVLHRDRGLGARAVFAGVGAVAIGATAVLARDEPAFVACFSILIAGIFLAAQALMEGSERDEPGSVRTLRRHARFARSAASSYRGALPHPAIEVDGVALEGATDVQLRLQPG